MAGKKQSLVTNFWFRNFVYRIMCGLFNAIDVARMHPMRERARKALKETVDYIEKNLPNAIGLDTPKELMDYALRCAPKEGHLLEFGVYTGGTIRYIAKNMPARIIHGFDSFKGLPEDWSGFNLVSRTFDMQGRLPSVPKNVKLHAGWFNDTLPQWLKEHSGQVVFMHIDCNIYSSTKSIFDLLGKRLSVGSLILFDEYFNYPNWQNHEFKAFQEFVNKNGVRYEYLGYSRQQVLVRIKQAPTHFNAKK